MEKQTALMQLKGKLQTVVDELKDAEPCTDQYGYRSAMENVIKDIDAQMLDIEKQQIVEFAEQYESYSWKASNDNRYKPRMTAAEYFESTFKTKEGK